MVFILFGILCFAFCCGILVLHFHETIRNDKRRNK